MGDYTNTRDTLDWSQFSLLLWVVGWLENWRVMLITAFNKVVVEVEAELGKNNKTAATKTITLMVCDTDEINLVKI